MLLLITILLVAAVILVDFVRRFGNKAYYGDASCIELLESAKARDARLFVLAIDDVELLEQQYAVRQDEQQLIQTSAPAAAQLQELFEADVAEEQKAARCAAD